MKHLGRLCVALLVAGCASSGNVIETRGTEAAAEAAIARVSIPYSLSLLAVDGVGVDAIPAREGYAVRLLPGEHRLRFAYERNWGSSRSYDWVYSDHVVEVALTAEAGVRYAARHRDIADRADADRLARDLRVWIDHPDGTRSVSRQVATHGSPGSRLLRGSTAVTTGTNETGADVAVAIGTTPAAAGAERTGDSVEEAAALLSEQDAFERLKLWWKLASKEDRRRFQAWLEAQ